MDAFRDYLQTAGGLMMILAIVFFIAYGLIKRVPIYESFVSGAKDGFTTSITILPYLVAILFAVAMFRASGALDATKSMLRPVMTFVGFPEDVLPMALIRSFTSAGSMAVLQDIKSTTGVNSEATSIAATIYASSETTFYVIAVYFGAVGIRKTRHAVPTGLLADAAGVILAIVFVRLLIGS
jgi:spore maturation protein B